MQMSNEQREKLESGTHVLIPKSERWIRYSGLAGVILMIFVMGITWGQSQDRMFTSSEQKIITVNHADEEKKAYKDTHKTVSELSDYFVTRKEYELLLKGQDEIKLLISQK